MKSLQRYSIGFVLSALTTLAAFWLVHQHLQSGHVFPTHEMLLPLLIVLAVAQLLIQLGFFMHIGDERKPRLNLLALLFALLIVTIVVGGSVIIMQSVSHGPPPPPKTLFDND